MNLLFEPRFSIRLPAREDHRSKYKNLTKKEGNTQTQQKLFVQGMHCASCETLIENEIGKEKGVITVKANTTNGTVTINTTSAEIDISKINKRLKRYGYQLSSKPFKKTSQYTLQDFLIISGTSLLLISTYYLIRQSTIASLVQVDSTSRLPAFFLLGVVAGFSTCAALVGSIVLSISQQWQGNKMLANLSFNFFRLLSFAFAGGLLGLVGSAFAFSSTLSAVFAILVSLIMIAVALRMVNIRLVRLSLPKFAPYEKITETFANSKILPAIIGFLTILLPCGFTLTAQSFAIASQNPVQGSLIMTSFALGTLPALLMIGLTSKFILGKTSVSKYFAPVTAVIIFFVALQNINAQLNVMNFPSLARESKQNSAAAETNNNATQVIRTNAYANRYEPNYYEIKKGVPVRWEITDRGTSGCTNAVIAKGLFEGSIPLKPGTTSVKEFTPTKIGMYKFSCWMGMVTGSIRVTD